MIYAFSNITAKAQKVILFTGEEMVFKPECLALHLSNAVWLSVYFHIGVFER